MHSNGWINYLVSPAQSWPRPYRRLTWSSLVFCSFRCPEVARELQICVITSSRMAVCGWSWRIGIRAHSLHNTATAVPLCSLEIMNRYVGTDCFLARIGLRSIFTAVSRLYQPRDHSRSGQGGGGQRYKPRYVQRHQQNWQDRGKQLGPSVPVDQADRESKLQECLINDTATAVPLCSLERMNRYVGTDCFLARIGLRSIFTAVSRLYQPRDHSRSGQGGGGQRYKPRYVQRHQQNWQDRGKQLGPSVPVDQADRESKLQECLIDTEQSHNCSVTIFLHMEGYNCSGQCPISFLFHVSSTVVTLQLDSFIWVVM